MVELWNELEIAKKITCENCKKKNVWGRRTEYKDSISGALRGYADICFECALPIMRISTRRGIFNTPMSRERYTAWLKEKEGE